MASSWLGIGGNDDLSSHYHLTIQAGSSTVGVSQTVPLVVRVIGFGDVPIKDSDIYMNSSNGGSFDGYEKTGANGFAYRTFTAGKTAGTTMISVVAFDAVATISIQVQPTITSVAQVTVFTITDQINPTESMPIQVYLADNTGMALDNTEVFLFAENGGTFSENTGRTLNGWFSTTFTAGSSEGQETIKAISLGQTASKTIAVRN